MGITEHEKSSTEGIGEKEKNAGTVDVLYAEDGAIDDLTKHGDMTATELIDAEEQLETMPLDRTVAVISQLYKLHESDQNFDFELLFRMDKFLHDPEVLQHPEQHGALVHEMRLEALIATTNSPYAIVRAVAPATDDPDMPALTIRVWVIGLVYSCIGAFVNQLFVFRNPPVSLSVSTAQLLAYPAGKLFEKILPDVGITLFGKRHSLNPGRFNLKEHMLITIMANVSFGSAYTADIVFVQALPFYFDQAYARGFSYQALNTLGSNLVGYGLAGLTRRFIVYPSYCVWPGSLSTIAMNKAFHTNDSSPIPGPFGRMYRWTMRRAFYIIFLVGFVYWWFPGFIWQNLTYFNWMEWIAPSNVVYAQMVSSNLDQGLGINPWPSFDWNFIQAQVTPLVTPLYTVMNKFLGMLFGLFMICGIYYTNTFNTAYLPINDNHVWANNGKRYNVTRILSGPQRLFDNDKYQQYSEPYMAAGNMVVYFWFFAVYSATITYVVIFHRHEIAYSFRMVFRDLLSVFKRRNVEQTDEHADDIAEDIHYRLMKSYKEVPEWWYFIILCGALALGMAGVGAYDTGVTMAVVIYGVIMALIFMVPIGLVYAVTYNEVTLNVLAEFIGGAMIPGNALAMSYFKMYGYITTAQAIGFASDLKLAHYVHIAPRLTFWAQLIPTIVCSLLQAGIFDFVMGFKNVCTNEASFGMSCPGVNTFFTAAVFYGTLGPKRVFGTGGRYTCLLIGFPVGFLMVLMYWGLKKAFPKSKLVRALHPALIASGGLQWAPYNLSHMVQAVYVSFLSWAVIKKRYLAFWSRYNYILATSLNAAIAILAVIIFFGLSIPNVTIDWWGNNPDKEDSCAGRGGCRYMAVPEKGYFGPEKGHFR
ncbi:hypothetical protein Q8F55_005413 [Vanrija albida]|uniref:OPT family small oligopeptide transporter n=1 Tax=Vanrija albida TaxID=181172 RepID=A0ABR3Q1L9_9TREE